MTAFPQVVSRLNTHQRHVHPDVTVDVSARFSHVAEELTD